MPLKFENLQGFLAASKLTAGESLQFYVAEDGKAYPATLWQVGKANFIISILCFAWGPCLIVRPGPRAGPKPSDG
jgi:hypothetical protein